MTAIIRYLDTYRRRETDGPSIDPDWLRSHLGNPPAGPEAINEQRWAAELVETDRETYRS
jgi:hypothetical protein